MSLTIEFYSAEPQEVQALFSARNENGDFERFFEKLERYPRADFSFHVHIPEDMDRLCQALRKHHERFPSTFKEIMREQLYDDGLSESLTLLNHNFAMALAKMNGNEMEQAALNWAATFPYQEPLQQTPAYQSLLHLREVALDAVTRNTSLLFYLEGNPAFFRW